MQRRAGQGRAGFAPTCRRLCGQPEQRLARRLPRIHHRTGAARHQAAAAVPGAQLLVLLQA